jgi:hypothetical protein
VTPPSHTILHRFCNKHGHNRKKEYLVVTFYTEYEAHDDKAHLSQRNTTALYPLVAKAENPNTAGTKKTSTQENGFW